MTCLLSALKWTALLGPREWAKSMVHLKLLRMLKVGQVSKLRRFKVWQELQDSGFISPGWSESCTRG